MQVKIGINPLSWTNDDLPSLGSETPLERCLSEGKLAGYQGFELGNKFPRNSIELSNILGKHDLELVSGWFSGNILTNSIEVEFERIKSHLDLLRSCNSNVVVYCDVSNCIHGTISEKLSYRPRLTESQFELFCSKINKLAKLCSQYGVKLAYHHHMGTIIQSQDEVDLLMSNTDDELGLLLDTGHITYAGGDPVDLIRKHGKRIIHVHSKDLRTDILSDAINRDISFLQAVLNGVFTVPGDGSVDFKAVFSELSKVNYKGWIVVEAEQDPVLAEPLKYAQLGYDTISRIVTNL